MFLKSIILLFLFTTSLSLTSCDDDPSLTGTWDCTLLTNKLGISHAVMHLNENSGQVTGTFKWIDLDLPLDGTVNSKRQVNMETQDSTHRCIFALRTLKDGSLDGTFAHYIYVPESQMSIVDDTGSFDATKR